LLKEITQSHFKRFGILKDIDTVICGLTETVVPAAPSRHLTVEGCAIGGKVRHLGRGLEIHCHMLKIKKTKSLTLHILTSAS